MRLESRRLWLGLAAAAIAAAVVLVMWSGRMDTRFSVWRLRERGVAVPWPAALRMMLPAALWPRLEVARVKAESGGPCPYLASTPLGDFWTTTKDTHSQSRFGFVVLEQLLDIYERGSVRVRPGDVVLDVGAYRGTFTRHALRQGARQVVAFEPEPVNYTCLEKTFAAEIARGAVRLVKAAVWETSGTLHFQGSGTTGHVEETGETAVPATSLDDAVRELGLERVDFIKMDIEGAERHALRGGSRTLQDFRPRMALCIYHLPDDGEVIPRLALERQPRYRVKRSGPQAFFW